MHLSSFGKQFINLIYIIWTLKNFLAYADL